MASNMDYEPENGLRDYDGKQGILLLQTRRIATDVLCNVDEPKYQDRDRSASPRPTRRNDSPRGGRSASPSGNGNGNGYMNDRYETLL